jgi:ribose transport system ATP-binding protein
MISSDLPEIMGVSDRVMIMYDGVVTGLLNRNEISEEAIGMCAFGRMGGQNL